MAIYDISLTISEAMVGWPGQMPLELALEKDMNKGTRANVTRLATSVHQGTHLDAPRHFIQGGATVETLDLNVLVGSALVIEALDIDTISAAFLEQARIAPGVERVLFHTRNSTLWERGVTTFQEDYVAVSADGAQWLVDHGIQLVGVDYLSVAPWDDLVTTHNILLGAGVIPVEGLNLTGIEPGLYQLICLSLKIAGSDGSPVRAILLR